MPKELKGHQAAKRVVLDGKLPHLFAGCNQYSKSDIPNVQCVSTQEIFALTGLPLPRIHFESAESKCIRQERNPHRRFSLTTASSMPTLIVLGLVVVRMIMKIEPIASQQVSCYAGAGRYFNMT
jgi:hypothetical protein